MGAADLEIISKSENINLQMESDLVYLMKDALNNRKDGYFIAKRCQESFGGSWIFIKFDYGQPGSSSFDMSFAFTSLKWIKFKYGHSLNFYLFQISE